MNRRTSSPEIRRSGSWQQQSLAKYQTENRSGLNSIKVAAKKVARVFAFLLFWKATSKGNRADEKKKQIQVRGVSSSTDDSKGSSSTKVSSKLKHSNSYGSYSFSSGQSVSANFSIEEIREATANFSEENKMGDGGFGIVYRGRLRDGSVVAVKRAKKQIYNKRTSAEFKNEILTLSKIEHLNLVRLYGYLEQDDEEIIVVEYVGNGTLRDHLDGTRGSVLEIEERLDIAIDVAHAITYLHTYTDLPIIHRDIKATNILITEKLRAKVADFGFAREAADDPGATHISTQIKGTAGYLDPEYLRTYQLTEKSDVYSFGILLVEMMTGRHPIEQKRPINERVTFRWAMQKLKDGEAVLAMDPQLRRGPASNKAVEDVLKLARQCIASARQARPSMKKCAEILWGIRKELRERSSSHPSTSYQSVNFMEKDTKRVLYTDFGLEEDDVPRFVSA
ncbi:Protein kinase domain [Dillenia turbinata]|uniref:non-specific serine/threonine protein kinase n=1 Tax=Dillenia turbinata TaxID=194707 RepID=A0AAN8ZCS0_9MAGN